MIILVLDTKIKSEEAISWISFWPNNGVIRIEANNSKYAVIVEFFEFKTLNPKILFFGKINFISFLAFKFDVHI